MIRITCTLLLCACSFVQAVSTDNLKPEQASTVGLVPSNASAQMVAHDAHEQAGKPDQKKRKVLKPEEKEQPFLNVLFSRKTLSTMDFDELKERKDECLAGNDKETAIKYLERMIHLKPGLNDSKSLMLEMAQLLFDVRDYTKSSQMFNEFALLYPGCDEVESAMYQAIVSTSNLMLDVEHDQSKTIEALELTQKFLERTSFTHYKKEVEVIASQCEERLLESDINIFNFYISRGNYVAANTRLESIKKEYTQKPIADVATRLACLDKCYADATVNIKLPELTTAVAVQNPEVSTEQATEQAV